MTVSSRVLVSLVEVVICSLSVKSWLQLVGRVEESLRVLVRIRHELLAFTELLTLDPSCSVLSRDHDGCEQLS